MKHQYVKEKVERDCRVGGMVATKIEELEGKIEELKGKNDALEDKLAAVLAATASDSGKFVKIGSDGKTSLVTGS